MIHECEAVELPVVNSEDGVVIHECKAVVLPVVDCKMELSSISVKQSNYL